MVTVTYIGDDTALTHSRPGGGRHTLFRGQPLEISDTEDIVFYRLKEVQGSPFRVEPKLVKEVVKEKTFPVPAPKTRTPRKAATGKKTSAAPSRRTPANIPKSEIFI
jgi:hypothetical protein